MLYTKCILKEKTIQDGVRISVMSRHTLNDGLTPDNRISEDNFDEHLKIVAPNEKLIGDYYKRGLDWKNYQIRYLEYLRTPDVLDIVKELSLRAIQQDITLLCIEDSSEYCHRRLLAEECQRHQPSLRIVHR